MNHPEPREYHLHNKDVPLAVFGNGDRQYGWLSNFSPKLAFRFNDWSYASGEVLFQELRADGYPDLQRQIRECNDARRAKTLARSIVPPQVWFDGLRVSAMRTVISAKFSTPMASKLLLDTGDLTIVEYSKFDAFWGAKPETDGTLLGCNVLGRLLMERREALKS